MDEKVPGGNKIALAEGESLHDSDSDRDDGAYTAGKGERMSHRTASQSLPRFLEADGDRVSGARKVDSLPVKILDESFATTGDKKTRAKKMIRSFGSFMQKVARQITSVTLYASPVSRFKTPAKELDTADHDSDLSRNGSSNSPKTSGKGHIHLAASEAGEKPPGVMGIHNHGNTCFMNAVLQCLSNTELLLSYFIMDQYKDDIKRSNKHNAKKFGTRGELTEHLATLLKSLWNCKYTPEISSEFKAIVAKYGCQYRGSSQHDAQEFLIWLLDKVHEDLNIATKKKYRANKSSYGRTDEDVAAEALANHARCNNSFIYDIFQALYRSSLTCPNCCHRSTTFDPFLSVSLPIPHKTSQPYYVTVVGGGKAAAASQIRFGFLLEQECLVKELRQALSTETKIPEESVLLIEIEGNGTSRSLNDNQPLSELSENVSLYALDVPQPTSTEEHPPGDELGATKVTVVVVKKLVKDSDSLRFGVPLVMQVVSDLQLAELKLKILELAMRPDAEQETLSLIDKDDFHLKYDETVLVEDGNEPCRPLLAENVKQALSSFSPGCGPQHILLYAEWTTKTDLPTSVNESSVEEHESVRQVKISFQQASLGTLDECFQVYTQEEQLGPDNAWLCPSCRKYQQGTVKALTLWSLPEVLVVHLKRFKQDAVHRTKLNTLIMFPINGLDLRHHVQKATPSSSSTLSRPVKSGAWTTWKPGRKTTDSSEDYLYDLYAVCNHYGDMHGGHYTAFCKNLCSSQWYSFNDSKASEMREGEVVTRAAYLLFYQKRSSHFPRSRDWLHTLQQIDYNVPRAATSHSLDDLLDTDCDTTADAMSPEDDFRRNIPVYTTLCPPARIRRHASARQAKAHTEQSASDSASTASSGSTETSRQTEVPQEGTTSFVSRSFVGKSLEKSHLDLTGASSCAVNGGSSSAVSSSDISATSAHETRAAALANPVTSQTNGDKGNVTGPSQICHNTVVCNLSNKSNDMNGTCS